MTDGDDILKVLQIMNQGSKETNELQMLHLQLAQDLRIIKLRNALLLSELKNRLIRVNEANKQRTEEEKEWKKSFVYIQNIIGFEQPKTL